MSEHPVRLQLTDDLERDRLTVFFRWLLAIPHFIWIGLWGVVAVLAAIVSWVATLALGRTPDSLHRFLAAYVRYATQFYGYVHLVANPYPAFTGRTSYPVDVTIAPPQPQSRISVLVRIFLLIPSALIAAALAGGPSVAGSSRGGRASYSSNVGLLRVAAFLGWFASLARARMPRGLRDAGAYSLSYGAQFWAYAFLLTDRYPNSDPMVALPEIPAREDSIHLELVDELRRSRLTVLFRLPLAVPHLVWLTLWGVLALLGAIVNWLVTLIAGRSPQRLHRFLAAYLRYSFHVYSFLYVIANPFPGFVGREGSYPFEIAVAGRARQNRWKTGFRLILALPALLLAGTYGSVALAAAVLGWFSSLARGRMPRGLRNAGALALRYQAQTHGYLLLLTDAYPYGGPARNAAPDAPAAPTETVAPSPSSVSTPPELGLD